jgi:hypothetical protein
VRTSIIGSSGGPPGEGMPPRQDGDISNGLATTSTSRDADTGLTDDKQRGVP